MSEEHDRAGSGEAELRSVLEELESRRRSIWRRFCTVAAIGAAVAVGGIVVGLSTRNPVGLFVGVIVGAAVAAIGWFALTRGFRREFKLRVIGGLARQVDPSLTYDPERHIDRARFRASGIFTHSIDRYNGEDYVRGQIGATAIEFSELHAQYRTTSHSKRGSSTQWHDIFKGLFIIADFNKHFRGMTLVLPDVAEKSFGWLGQKLQDMFDFVRRGELVKLEDPEFEREFVVYADDQVEARYILTPALMRRLLDFKRRTGNPVCFSFVGSSVCIAVSQRRNMFEPRMSRSLLDPALVREYLADLEFAAGIVHDLDLNTRIWTKE